MNGHDLDTFKLTKPITSNGRVVKELRIRKVTSAFRAEFVAAVPGGTVAAPDMLREPLALLLGVTPEAIGSLSISDFCRLSAWLTPKIRRLVEEGLEG